MKKIFQDVWGKVLSKYPTLDVCTKDVQKIFVGLEKIFLNQGTLWVCGNGGSASDAEHFSAELLKGFTLNRPISAGEKKKLADNMIAENLQKGLPVLPLSSFSSIITAVINDQSAELVFAQPLYALARKNDALLAISTSGNSKNVVAALKVARLKGMQCFALTGNRKGAIEKFCHSVIRVPASHTPDIQELHLPVYHALAVMLEERFFK